MSGTAGETITISVEGYRTEPRTWDIVRALPKEQLPPLTEAQRDVAASLRIPEEDYARSVEAGRRAADELMQKTARFARLLQEKLRERHEKIQIEGVALNTREHRFEVLLRVDGRLETLRMVEDIVDGLFEEGSREAEERLSRVLEYGLSPVGRE